MDACSKQGGNRKLLRASQTFSLIGNQVLLSPEISMRPDQVDFVRVVLAAKPELITPNSKGKIDGQSILALSWLTEADPGLIASNFLTLPLTLDDQQHEYLFNVSEHKSWLMSGKIAALRLAAFPGPCLIDLKEVSATNSSAIVPLLEVTDYSDGRVRSKLPLFLDPSGILYPQGLIGPLKFDARQINGAQKVMFEISKTNYWFEHASGTFTDNQLSKSASRRGWLTGLSGTNATVDCTGLTPGFYELRVAAVDGAEKLIGRTSFPINFQISQR
jgi:hypothetical protein